MKSDPTYLYALGSPFGPSIPGWAYALMVIGGLIVLGITRSAFRIIQEYEVGLVIRFGRVVRECRPGLRLVIPLIERMFHMDMQVFTLALEPQQVITQDSVSLEIRAVVYYRVSNARMNYAVLDDDNEAIKQLAQALMRRVTGHHTLGTILEHAQTVTGAIHEELAAAGADWGLEITRLEITDIDLPKSMQRAMAAKAEAIRTAEATVEAAKGDKLAAEIFAEMAAQLTPTTLRLFELQVIREVGADNATVVLVPSGSSAELTGAAAAGAIAANQL